jgi:hypothetical protein
MRSALNIFQNIHLIKQLINLSYRSLCSMSRKKFCGMEWRSSISWPFPGQGEICNEKFAV